MDQFAAAEAAGPRDASPALRPVRFDAADLPARERFEVWRSTFSSVNDLHRPEGAAADFRASNENWRLGSLLFTRNRTPPLAFARGPGHARRDGLDHFVLRLLRRGQVRSASRGVEHATGAGDLFLFHLGEPRESGWTEAEWFSLCIPREAIPGLAPALDLLGSGPLRMPGAALLVDYLGLLARRLDRATLADLPSLTRATGAMVLASLQPEGAPAGRIREALERSQFERARTVILRHLAEASLTPERVARECGVARSSLYRCFAAHGGVAGYIQAERLRRVRQMMAEPGLAHLPVARLAERVGFFDASAFSRLFRRSFGIAPRDFRQMALAGRHADALRRTLPETSFGAMLRALGTGSEAAHADALLR